MFFVCLISCTWIFSACSQDREIPEIYLNLPNEIAVGSEVNVLPKIKDNKTTSTRIKFTVKAYTSYEDIKIDNYKFIIKYPTTHYIEIEAEDEAGNQSYKLISFNGVDVTPPQIELYLENELIVGEKYYIRFSVIDNVSLLEKIKVYINVYLFDEEVKVFADNSFIPQSKGIYEIVIRACDEVGNSNESIKKIKAIFKS